MSSLIPSDGGEPGLHLVRARTDRPGALVHRAITLRAASDGAVSARLRPCDDQFLLDPDGHVPQPRLVRRDARGRSSSATRPGSASSSASRWSSSRAGCRTSSPRPAASSPRYVGARADDLTFVQNATTGVNMAARSLDLRPGDEVLSTEPRVRRVRPRVGVAVRAYRCTLRPRHAAPVTTSSTLFEHVTERTKAVFVSHITSETGLLLPVEDIVAPRARPRSRDDRRRRARAGAGRPRPRRARRGLLRRQLPQVDVRAEGRRVPARAARVAGARRRPDRELGLRGAGDVHQPHRAAGDARLRRVSHRARRDRVPARARRARPLRRARARGAARPVRATTDGADRTRGDGPADGDACGSPSPTPISSGDSSTSTASRYPCRATARSCASRSRRTTIEPTSTRCSRRSREARRRSRTCGRCSRSCR